MMNPDETRPDHGTRQTEAREATKPTVRRKCDAAKYSHGARAGGPASCRSRAAQGGPSRWRAAIYLTWYTYGGGSCFITIRQYV